MIMFFEICQVHMLSSVKNKNKKQISGRGHKLNSLNLVHSLNLVSLCQKKNALKLLFSFHFFKYTFISSSTYRSICFYILKNCIQKSNTDKNKNKIINIIKAISDTRWFARVDTLRTLISGYTEI